MANAERIVDWDQLYPGRFFKAGLLAPNEKRILTISGIDLDELEGRKGLVTKGCLSFQEDKMQLPLNKTNGICLREMFGRVPYKWVGKRFAIFADTWNGEPCIRIWGSPDIAEDMSVTIELPKRTFKMVMHAMGDDRSLHRAATQAERKIAAVKLDAMRPKDSNQTESIRDRAQELIDMMGRAGALDELSEIRTVIQTETDDFNAREHRVLAKALERRFEQLKAAEAPPPDSDNIPF